MAERASNSASCSQKGEACLKFAAEPMIRGAKSKKLSRKETAAHLQQALIESAIQSAGSVGFSCSSVSRITEAAGVAQGTLYSYWGSQQQLLNELLPIEGARLLQALGEHSPPSDNFFEEERRRFRRLLAYLEERPFILRLLIEAEVATPDAFFQYMGKIGERYTAVFKVAQKAGEMRSITARESQVLAETLAGCRAHIALHLLGVRERDPAHLAAQEDAAVEAYVKFLRFGLGGAQLATFSPRRRLGAPVRRRAVSPGSHIRALALEAAGPQAASGFNDILVKEVASRAGISIGTFYSYFGGRDQFLSELLVYARRHLTAHVARATADSQSFVALETRSFQAFFAAVSKKPWLTRLAAEAAVWKPMEYSHHFAVISRDYRRRMVKAKGQGELTQYTVGEIEYLSVIFTAARRFLGTRFLAQRGRVLPKWVVKSYMSLVCCGLATNAAASTRKVGAARGERQGN
jgi:AcrR family transcriptional regulator